MRTKRDFRVVELFYGWEGRAGGYNNYIVQCQITFLWVFTRWIDLVELKTKEEAMELCCKLIKENI